ncbi:hypothetical protein OH76DRAFT_468533 [Lentinus brumalis]|uniref:Uncharacterized protein n=1 Tax=Lentinus brumalis TaxID=2498619 RepID=A0A371DCQ0_9APHY|nr:hypothetical protein OH76DRAFT_468533 [Polyporus brumalis]
MANTCPRASLYRELPAPAPEPACSVLRRGQPPSHDSGSSCPISLPYPAHSSFAATTAPPPHEPLLRYARQPRNSAPTPMNSWCSSWAIYSRLNDYPARPIRERTHAFICRTPCSRRRPIASHHAHPTPSTQTTLGPACFLAAAFLPSKQPSALCVAVYLVALSGPCDIEADCPAFMLLHIPALGLLPTRM